MKTFLLCCFLLLATRAFGQGFAPTSLSNQVYTVVVSSGNGVFATSGVASKVFLANGQAVVLDASGDILVDQRASYTYTKTGPNSGTITQVLANGALTTEARLTFVSPVTGTYSASVLAGATGTQLATFSLAPATQPPLINLSTRTSMAQGGQTIVGFVVNGAGPSRVVVRAIGPGLEAFKVEKTLSDPRLQIYRSGASAPLATVEAWGASVASAASLSDAFAAVGAFSLSKESRDSAVLLNLEPGAYSAVVTSTGGGGSGEVLVEVYLYP